MDHDLSCDSDTRVSGDVGAVANKPEYILVHCTDVSMRSNKDQFASVNAYHRDSRGFNRSTLGIYVGYHVLITGDKAYRCRVDDEYGNHCNAKGPYNDGLSMNFHSLGICIGFDGDVELPTEKQAELLKDQVKRWMFKHNIPLERVMFHRDFSPEKTCPGSLITRAWLVDLLKVSPPPVPASPVKPPEQVEKQEGIEDAQKELSLLQRIIELLQQLLFLRTKKVGMNPENLPGWYKSTAGPGVSQTISNIALSFLPVLNLALASKGIEIMPEDVNFWVSLVVFFFFAVQAGIGYIRSKKILGARIGALRSQVSSLGGRPE